MTEINRGIDRVGRRAKRFLSPSQKYEIWLQLIRQEMTIAEAAEQQHVDRSTIMRIHRVSARTGGVDALRQERLHPAVDRHVIHGDARSASNSSTSRSDSPQRRYQRTATAMTSRRKRYPAGAEDVDSREVITTPVSSRHGDCQRNRASEGSLS
jgi:transposase